MGSVFLNIIWNIKKIIFVIIKKVKINWGKNIYRYIIDKKLIIYIEFLKINNKRYKLIVV